MRNRTIHEIICGKKIKKMKLFNQFFSRKTTESNQNKLSSPWVALTSIAQIEEIKEVSKKNTVAVFKHSTRCIISETVLRAFEKKVNNEAVNSSFYYLDLLNYRAVSDELSAVFEVIHQSPQLLLIDNEKLVSHASHDAILELPLNILTK